MNSSTIVLIQNGIISGLSLFFTVGGTILVVLASIWGFGKIQNLFSDSGSSGGSGGCRREGHDEMDVHSRYIDRYGMEAYNKRFGG